MTTLSSLIRISAMASIVCAGLLSACGGKVFGTVPGGDGGDGFGGGSVGNGGDAKLCVEVALSSFDQSCNQDSDCATITTGTLCTGDCRCGGATINQSGLARYESETSGLGVSACHCPLEGIPHCISGTCSLCGPGSPDPSCGDGGTVIGDGGIYETSTYETSVYESSTYEATTIGEGSVGSDGSTGACVDIVLSTYDQTCKVSSDCISITSGTLCSGSCDCGGSTINKDGQARYDAAISGIMFGACPCPAPPPASCKLGMCATGF
jgi:hypothetical protein